MMKWTALALLGVNLLLGLTLALRGDPPPPQTAFPESDAPPIVLLAELTPPPQSTSSEHHDESAPAPAEHGHDGGNGHPSEASHAVTEATPSNHGLSQQAAPQHTPPQQTGTTPPPADHTAADEHAQSAGEPHPTPTATTADHTETAKISQEARETAESETVAALAQRPTPLPELKPPTRHDYCYRIGPVSSKKTLATLRKRLQRQLGTAGRTESRKVPIKVGYWVYLPPQPLPKAEATARDLRRKGVKDLYILRDGDNRGAISLGLYRQRHFAERRRKQLAGWGIQAQLGPRHKPGYQYWVNLKIQAEKPPSNATWRVIKRGLKGISQHRRDCA